MILFIEKCLIEIYLVKLKVIFKSWNMIFFGLLLIDVLVFCVNVEICGYVKFMKIF